MRLDQPTQASHQPEAAGPGSGHPAGRPGQARGSRLRAPGQRGRRSWQVASHGISQSSADRSASDAPSRLSVEEHMPDPRAQRLKARCGSGPSDGPALHTRCPGAADAAAGPTTSCPPNRRARRLPARPAPIPPKPPPAPSCSRTAPNQRCIRLAAALVITCGKAQLNLS